MGNKKTLIYGKKGIVCLLALSFTLINCASLKKQTNFVYEKLLISMRKPGEKLMSLPQEVWQENDCDNKKRPYKKIETFEVIPKIIQPGKSFNLRFLYSLCSSERFKEIVGTLFTRISFRDKYIVNDKEEKYAMKPGRWLTDTFIDLPRTAKVGVYKIELEFSSSELQFKRQTIFVIEN